MAAGRIVRATDSPDNRGAQQVESGFMRRKWMAGGLAVVAAGAGVTTWVLDRGEGRSTKAVVATVAADTGAVVAAVAATGSVQPADTRPLSFAVDGTVETVQVRPGARVAKGAVLATVDDTAAMAAVVDAEDTLADARAQLVAASAGVRAAGTQAVGAQVAGLQATAAQPVGADAIFAAKERVNQAKTGLAETRDALAGTAIKAPMAGTVMAVAGTVGSDAGKGAAFVTLADTRMEVSASFPEADAGSLAVGQAATVTLADRVGEEFPAKVVQVDPLGVSDGTLVTYGVLLSFTQQPADLLSGQSAAVEVTTGSVASALRVPSTAVHDAGTGKGIVRTADGRSVPVGVGLRGDPYTQITSGLTEGEAVVRSW
jgi:RND family efflux transporter MFP subunit